MTSYVSLTEIKKIFKEMGILSENITDEQVETYINNAINLVSNHKIELDENNIMEMFKLASDNIKNRLGKPETLIINKDLADKLRIKVKQIHTCPFREDVYNDHDTLCDCNEDETSQCTMDI